MTTKWKLDPAHSEITFKVRHMMISNVKGSFTDFDAEIETETDDFKNAEVRATIQAASITTNNTDRDAHLRGEDFFNTEKNPVITFEAEGLGENAEGLLTINGVKKPIKLAIEFGGLNTDPWGHTKAGFSFEGKLNRKEYNLNWNTALETGGVMVSDEVKIMGDLQFTKQQ